VNKGYVDDENMILILQLNPRNVTNAIYLIIGKRGIKWKTQAIRIVEDPH
jgi:hypothetical protein